MAIEFRCETCGKLLRTGPENAGRGAKCPGCGDILAVPLSHPAGNADFRPPTFDEAIARGGHVAPHRGGIILAFGILSWATCFLFGVAAWAMGAEDLQAMRTGEMDNSGEAVTRAGMYLGLANVIFILLVLLGIIGIAGLAILFG